MSHSKEIYLAADHRGFELKEKLKVFLAQLRYEVIDVGAYEYNQRDDYVDFAKLAAQEIAQQSTKRRGIFLCGSGHGMDIVANKYKGVRAALCFNKEVAKQSRAHDNSNVLVLPADWLEEKEAKEVVKIWISTKFSNEKRHKRRLDKIREIEKENFFK